MLLPGLIQQLDDAMAYDAPARRAKILLAIARRNSAVTEILMERGKQPVCALSHLNSGTARQVFEFQSKQHRASSFGRSAA